MALAQGAAGKELGHLLFSWLHKLCPTKGLEVQHMDLCTGVPLSLPSHGAGGPLSAPWGGIGGSRSLLAGFAVPFPPTQQSPCGGTRAMGERPPTLYLAAALEPLPQHPEVVHHDPPEEVGAVLKGDLQLIQHRLLHLESVWSP